MRRFLAVLFVSLLYSAAPGYADISLSNTNHLNGLADNGWNNWYGNASIDSSTSAPGSSPNSLRFTYPSGFPGGNSPAALGAGFTQDTPELWFEYWFRYPSNWQSHPAGDKQTYWSLLNGRGTNGYGEFMIIKRADNGGKLCWCWQSNIDQRAFNLCGNTSGSSYVTHGVWHKVRGHVINNTPGSSNGVVQLWLDGVQTHNYSNVLMKASSVPANINWHYVEIAPVWGGVGSTKSQTDYFWVDYMIISSSPIGTGDPPPPSGGKTPRPPSSITIK